MQDTEEYRRMERATGGVVEDRHYAPVRTKRDFVQRYAAGEFGNASPTWGNLVEAVNSHPDPEALYHIRNRVAGGPTFYNVPYVRLGDRWMDLLSQGVDPASLYISAMAPTAETLLQGEIHQYCVGGSPALYYTQVAKPMRDALKEDSHEVRGVVAVAILRHYLCPNSYEWLETLLSRYPGHVIEFSTYAREWGTLPGYNTVFWEVRQY